ncbi:MAG: ATP-binding protein, partial [Caldimonas sp.]
GVVVEENDLQVQISALRKLLGPQAIATVPGRGYRFTGALEGVGSGASLEAKALEAQPLSDGSVAATGALRSNFPAVLPTLYGRHGDVTALCERVLAHRLVSLVGTGGIGETVLAQVAAERLRDSFEGGAWLVELAAVSRAPQVVPAVAGVLQVPIGEDASASALAERLRGAPLLLVLDNCEHLLDPVAELGRALHERAPGVHLLITSQETLKLADEHVFRLDTLEWPAHDGTDAAAARSWGAVALFAARAQAADPRFELSADNVAAVVDICRHLDGLPLAIELAAARVPLLGLHTLHARLDERFHILTAGHRLALHRHQTLRAALEWSHGLLTEPEQAVFRRLGVFVGSFDLDRAQEVAAGTDLDGWAVLDHLGALVDKSLVVAQPGEPPRYRLLESGRAFALEKLQLAGETEAMMDRHLEAMRNRFEESVAQRWQLPANTLRDRYSADLDNLRAALDGAARDGAHPEALVALAGASGWLWILVQAPAEGDRRLRQALARLQPSTPKRLEARLLLAFAGNAHPRATTAELRAIDRSIELSRETGDRAGLFLALATATFRWTKVGRLDDAERAAAEAQVIDDAERLPTGLSLKLPTFRAHLHERRGRHDAAWADKESVVLSCERMGDARGARLGRASLADLALARGDVDEAVRRGRELVAALRSAGLLQSEGGISCANLCAALTQRGELDEARAMAREALPSLQRRAYVHWFLDHLALLAWKLGRPADAARALGRSDALALQDEDRRDVNEQRAHDQVAEALRSAMPASELARRMREGAEMNDEDVFRAALGG